MVDLMFFKIHHNPFYNLIKVTDIILYSPGKPTFDDGILYFYVPSLFGKSIKRVVVEQDFSPYPLSG
jgi:hypothetical protein